MPAKRLTRISFIEIRTPNAKTISAMKAARGGELVTVGSPAKLLASLKKDNYRQVTGVGAMLPPVAYDASSSLTPFAD